MSNRIQYWLSSGGERIQLPVNPPSFKVPSPYGFEDVSVHRLGEYQMFGDKGLAEFSIESFFPRDYNEAYCEYNGFPDPLEIVTTIELWRQNEQPVRLTVTGTGLNVLTTLRNAEYEFERSGSPGDVYFSLDFKEYREINVRQVESGSSGGGNSQVKSDKKRPSEKSTPKTYTVKSGDILSKIALKVGVSNWRDLYEANKDTIGNNPNLIKPGQKLVIPNV